MEVKFKRIGTCELITVRQYINTATFNESDDIIVYDGGYNKIYSGKDIDGFISTLETLNEEFGERHLRHFTLYSHNRHNAHILYLDSEYINGAVWD